MDTYRRGQIVALIDEFCSRILLLNTTLSRSMDALWLWYWCLQTSELTLLVCSASVYMCLWHDYAHTVPSCSIPITCFTSFSLFTFLFYGLMIYACERDLRMCHVTTAYEQSCCEDSQYIHVCHGKRTRMNVQK